MKKWVKRGIIILVIASVIGVFVYHYLMNKLSEEISSQISEYEKMAGNDSALEQLKGLSIEDDAIAKTDGSINNEGTTQKGKTYVGTSQNGGSLAKNENTNNIAITGTEKQGSGSHPNNSSTTKKMAFSSRQAAIKYGLSKFSASEINHFRKLASDGLTAAEKTEIKNTIYSKFSQGEINAIRKALSN